MNKKPASENKQHLSNLLALYKKRFRPPQASVEKEVIEAIREVTGLALSKEQIEFTVSTKTISLKVPSILKSEIKSHQQAIQDTLHKKMDKTDVPAIYF